MLAGELLLGLSFEGEEMNPSGPILSPSVENRIESGERRCGCLERAGEDAAPATEEEAAAREKPPSIQSPGVVGAMEVGEERGGVTLKG